jgi:hypothetical protein
MAAQRQVDGPSTFRHKAGADVPSGNVGTNDEF